MVLKKKKPIKTKLKKQNKKIKNKTGIPRTSQNQKVNQIVKIYLAERQKARRRRRMPRSVVPSKNRPTYFKENKEKEEGLQRRNIFPMNSYVQSQPFIPKQNDNVTKKDIEEVLGQSFRSQQIHEAKSGLMNLTPWWERSDIPRTPTLVKTTQRHPNTIKTDDNFPVVDNPVFDESNVETKRKPIIPPPFALNRTSSSIPETPPPSAVNVRKVRSSKIPHMDISTTNYNKWAEAIDTAKTYFGSKFTEKITGKVRQEPQTNSQATYRIKAIYEKIKNDKN